jgi:uncharacterized membrane protein YhaH (DUF805 family)
MKKFFFTRLNRKKYFLYSVLPYLILIILSLPVLRNELYYVLSIGKGLVYSPILLYLMFGGIFFDPLVVFIVSCSLILFISGSIRRLHDLGKSGWWYLLLFTSMIFIPLFPLVLLYLIFKEGEKQTNKWGDSN